MGSKLIYVYDVFKDGSGSCKVNWKTGKETSPDMTYVYSGGNTIQMNGVILKYNSDNKATVTYTDNPNYPNNPSQIIIQRGYINQECVCQLQTYSLILLNITSTMTPTVRIEYATDATSTNLSLCPNNGKIVIDNLLTPRVVDTSYQMCYYDRSQPVPVDRTQEKPISCSIS